MRRALLALGLLLATAPAFAKMQAKPVEWTVGNERFSGYVIYDDAGGLHASRLFFTLEVFGHRRAAIHNRKHRPALSARYCDGNRGRR